MYTLGMDIGSSSVKVVAVDEHEQVLYAATKSHKGNPAQGARALLQDMAQTLDLAQCSGWVATGSGASILRDMNRDVVILEDVPAICRGAQLLAPEARAIIEMGAQSSVYVVSSASADSPAWSTAPQFAMNESCASGTGSFFEDQMERLGMSIEDYSQVVADAQSVPRLSGRCSVFAKTDIIHCQQEGIPVQDILLGLCYATVKTFKATIVRGLPVEKPLALSGGVLANQGVVRAVQDVFQLKDNELLVDDCNVYFQAAGAALHAAQTGTTMSLVQVIDCLSGEVTEEPLPRLEKLPALDYEPGQGYHVRPKPWVVQENGKVACALGVDVGSTSTNLVLIDTEGQLLDAQYLRTRGNPKDAVREGLASLYERLGQEIEIISVGATGSGRTMIGKFIGADVVRDEITAQARGAAAADELVDTVFEIGGQDSKYISLSAGQVVDFQMNKICAAGTGSFVEEQAARLGIPLAEYGDLALSAAAPVDLGERCTVFVETAINTALSRGAEKSDIAAGLCLSIVRNYLHKVVGTKPVGQHVVLQGGVAYNPGIVAAFKAFYGDCLTVSPWFAVSGAVGAGLLALEAQVESTAFRGFDLSRSEVQAAVVDPEEVRQNREFFRKLDDLFLEGYDPTIDPEKETVGIPRCLMLHKLFPMANAFFRKLGYNVIISDASNEETIKLSQATAQGETCYPVKLVHGHMEQLMQRGVDYIFMPAAHTIRHPKSSVMHNYACPYMQTAPMLAARELKLEERGVTLLSPRLEMDFGQQAIATALLGVGAQLGKTPQETAKAMLAGGFAVSEFTRKTEELGEQLLNSLKPGERVLVLITRNYGIVDPALNMGIPDALLDRGQKVVTVSHLHAHDLDISQDYPGLFWPFGQHIVSGAKLIKRDPRLFAVYLTNHGCGPDTMMAHLFKEEMGDKPYLHIEMDEHFSQVGVITRIEAFLNSLDHYQAKDERAVPLSLKKYRAAHVVRSPELPSIVPSIGEYGPLVALWLQEENNAVALGGQAAPVSVVVPSHEAIAKGRAESISKEYLTFTALLGMSLQTAEAAEGPVQLLLPSTQGAEADGQYDRVIRSILDAKGYTQTHVIAPYLEQLPWVLNPNQAEQLFIRLLAGDVLYAAPAAFRDGFRRQFAEPGLTFERVCAAATQVAQFAAQAKGKSLALVGEWPCVYSDELTENMWQQIEAEDYTVRRMPLSEYMWMLWHDARVADAREKSKDGIPFLAGSSKGVMDLPADALAKAAEACESAAGGHCGADHPAAGHHDTDHCGSSVCGAEHMAETLAHLDLSVESVDAVSSPTVQAVAIREESNVPVEEKDKRLDYYARMMDEVSQRLGAASPFTADLNHLMAVADRELGAYRGANGRYRAAKAIDMSTQVDGVLVVSSMYENTDTVLKLTEDAEDFGAPVLHLAFDGVLDQSLAEKLHSFLYYV